MCKMHAHTHTHMHMYTHTHACTHTHTCTNTYTQLIHTGITLTQIFFDEVVFIVLGFVCCLHVCTFASCAVEAGNLVDFYRENQPHPSCPNPAY